jgi:exonuclease III
MTGRAYRSPAVLKLGTHNVNGLTPTKLPQLLQLWDLLDLSIICIQEHKRRSSLEHPALDRLFARPGSGKGWTVFWRYNIAGAESSSRGSAGVAIAVRSALIRDNVVSVQHSTPNDNAALLSWALAGHEDGRSVSLDINWGGHKLMLGNVYLPNDSVSRKLFIQQRIVKMQRAATAKGGHLVLCGDFNFVHNPSLDRLCAVNGTLQHPVAVAEATANVWAEQADLEVLVDVWRQQHPTARYMSWMRPRISPSSPPASASRLDRFYVPETLSNYTHCPAALPVRALRRALHGSDHAPVVCHLTARSRSDTDLHVPGAEHRLPPRLNLSFMKDEDLRVQFAAWLETKLAAMPVSDTVRLKWWVKFKNKKMRWKIYCLNKEYFQLCHGRVSLEQLRDALGTLLTQINGSNLDEIAEAMEMLPQVKAQITQAEEAIEVLYQNKTRRAWIHTKERPSRALSLSLSSRKGEVVAALKDRSGVIHTSAGKCANLVIDYWAGVSAAPSTTMEARTQVLAALNADSLPAVDATTAAQLGAEVVTEAEMLATLRKCSPHTAPGADGISMKLYKGFKTQFAPMLAAVFTAFGRLRKVPKRFLHSVITILHKQGSRLETSNYRPISLTNTDYRLLARALARRLGEVLQSVIDPAQTAFLRGRHIGDNAMLLQFLPAWLHQQERTALVAFCDFRKAYDTVDRGFLLDVAAQMGLGNGFISWMKLILTSTKSAAVIDGYLSDYRTMLAGVRQGCPLAPLLYLLVAQAALSWLKSKGIGVQVDGDRITAAQFADDLKALLEGPEQVEAFVAAMKVFAEASGQELLPSKSKLLPIGKPPATPLPESIAELPVVDSVKALGMTFAAFSGQVSVDWKEQIEKVHQRVAKIVKCKLSSFGRAFAINGYAISKILFHSQFVGLPGGADLDYLERLLAAAVDSERCLRLQGEAGATQRHFTHVAKELLVGHPSRGGFGLLPLQAHVGARMAWWACRLLSDEDKAPWVRVGRAVLTLLMARDNHSASLSELDTPYCAPRLRFLCAIKMGLETYLVAAPGVVPQVLVRMAEALAALPRPSLITPLIPGPWCAHVPLWGNPILMDSGTVPLERGTLKVQQLKTQNLATVGDLLRTRVELKSMDERGFLSHWKNLTYAGRPPNTPLRALPSTIFRTLRTRAAVVEMVDAAVVEIYERLPQGWFDAAAAQDSISSATSSETAEELIVSSMGWQLGTKKLTLASLSVKAGTLLQIIGQPSPHFPQFQRYAALISAGTSPARVQGMLARVWKLPVEGRALTPLWYLVLNGIPSAERMTILLDKPCGCGQMVGPGRVHLFFECAILQPALQSLAAQFQGEWSLTPPGSLLRQHLWLAVKPHRNMHQGLWDIVVIYTLRAFDEARRNWTDRVLKHARGASLPSRSSRAEGSMHRPATAPGDQMVVSVGNVVLTEVWAGLKTFVALNTLPSAWLAAVPLDHPFIHPDPERRTWIVERLEMVEQ